MGKGYLKQNQKTNGNLEKRCANHTIDIKLFFTYKELLQIIEVWRATERSMMAVE